MAAGQDREVTDDAVHCRTGTDQLGRDVIGRSQRRKALFVTTLLRVSLRHIHE